MENDIESFAKGAGLFVMIVVVFCAILSPAWIILYLLHKGAINSWTAAIGIPAVYLAIGFYKLCRIKH